MTFLCYILIFSSILSLSFIFPSLDSIRFFFLLSAIVCVSAFNRLYNQKPWEKIPLKKLIFIMFLAYIMSEAQHINVHRTFNTTLYWGKKILLFYSITAFIDDPKKLKNATWAAVLSCTGLAFFAYEFYNADPTLSQWDGRLQSVGWYNLSNSYALIITVIWPVLFVLYEIEQSVLKKLFLLLNMVVFYVFGLLTKSRGGILGMTFAVLLSIMLSNKLVKGKKLKLICLTGVVGLLFTVGLSLILERSNVGGMLGGDNSAIDRIVVWKAAFRMLLHHPLFGIGWNHFYDEVILYGAGRRLIAHNTIISVFAETGLFGGITFLLILKNIFFGLKDVMKNADTITKNIARGFFISLCAFLINTSFSVKDHDPSFWLIISLSAVCLQLANKHKIDSKYNFNNSKI